MLDGKVVLITGGAGLLGKAFARAVAESGGLAIIADVDPQAGAEIAAQITQDVPGGLPVENCVLDITSEESIESAKSQILASQGRIDALVNSAYPRTTSYGRPFLEIRPEDFKAHVDAHLGGYFAASQSFARLFIDQNSGHIINISSIYGVVPPRFELYEDLEMGSPPDYALCKAALIHFTRYMAKFFRGTNVRANCISLGGIFDHQNEVFLRRYRGHCNSKGMLDAGDITATLIYLLSSNSKAVNGQNIVVDDGFTL